MSRRVDSRRFALNPSALTDPKSLSFPLCDAQLVPQRRRKAIRVLRPDVQLARQLRLPRRSVSHVPNHAVRPAHQPPRVSELHSVSVVRVLDVRGHRVPAVKACMYTYKRFRLRARVRSSAFNAARRFCINQSDIIHPSIHPSVPETTPFSFSSSPVITHAALTRSDVRRDGRGFHTESFWRARAPPKIEDLIDDH